MPDVVIPDWPRPHFEPSGSVASVFYLVVGPPPESLNIKRARHHVDRIEENLIVSRHTRAQDPAWFDAWFNSPAAFDLDAVFGAAAADVRAADQLSVVRGDFPDPPTLGYLRNTIGVVSAIADCGAVAVFDVLALTWWRPDDWRRRFVDASEFRIDEQIFIAVTDDPRHHPGLWTHTRGMKKFGRPDLQMKHLPGGYDVTNPAIRDSGTVLNGVASYLAQGAVVRDGQTLHLPTVNRSVAFFESPADDPEARRHFGNAVLEICDVNPQTGLSEPGVGRLLDAMAQQREQGT